MIGKEVFALGLLVLLIYIKWQITKESFGKVKVRKFVMLLCPVDRGWWRWAVFRLRGPKVLVCVTAFRLKIISKRRRIFR